MRLIQIFWDASCYLSINSSRDKPWSVTGISITWLASVWKWPWFWTISQSLQRKRLSKDSWDIAGTKKNCCVCQQSHASLADCAASQQAQASQQFSRMQQTHSLNLHNYLLTLIHNAWWGEWPSSGLAYMHKVSVNHLIHAVVYSQVADSCWSAKFSLIKKVMTVTWVYTPGLEQSRAMDSADTRWPNPHCIHSTWSNWRYVQICAWSKRYHSMCSSTIKSL